ncbi:MAG TPA: tetratricopeptide repeat protein [Burkholderiales bacterium]|nr:tetratricopeptide repeat protein [Burkholderiales bacterium]
MKTESRKADRQLGWAHKQLGLAVAPPDRWLIGLIVLVACLIYAPFVHNPLQFDDFNFFNARSWTKYFSTWHLLALRAIPYATLSDTLGWFGSKMVLLRIESLFIHSLNGIFLYVWLKRLFATLPGRPAQPAAEWLAFLGALWFVASPVAVYGAGYLVERTILMATMFALLALCFWVKGITTGSYLNLYAAAFFCWLSILCKELAVMLPALLALQQVALSGFNPRRMRQSAVPLCIAGLASVYAYWMISHTGIIGHAYEFNAQQLLQRTQNNHPGFDLGHDLFLSRLTQATLFFKYLGIWLVPVTAYMSIDMYVPLDLHVSNPFYLFGALGYLLYGAVGLYLIVRREEKGLLGLAMLVPWVFFFTEFSVIRVQDIFVLYRSYLWMFSLPVALPWLVRKVSARLVLGLISILILVSIPLSIDRLESLSSPYLTWNDAAKLAEREPALPGMERIYYNRGNAELMSGQYSLARADYDRAIHLRPNYAAAWNNLANVYYARNHFGNAENDFRTALRLDPTLSQSWVGLGLCLERKGEKPQAINAFQQGCRLENPNSCMDFQGLNKKSS